MSLTRKLRTCSAAVFLGTAAMAAGLIAFSAAPVLAKGGDNGGGNGGGNGGENGKGSERSSDKGNNGKSGERGKSAEAHAKSKGQSGQTGKPAWAGAKSGGSKPVALAAAPVVQKSGNGNLRSSMGALNAGHASLRALERASPNSRPGKLNLYREAILDASVSQMALNEIYGHLKEEYPGADLTDLDALIEAIGGEIADLDGQILDADGDIADFLDANDLDPAEYDGWDPLLQDEYDGLIGAKAALEGQKLDKEADLAAIASIGTLEKDVAFNLEASKDLLEDAANKPLPGEDDPLYDQIVGEVNRLLGVEIVEPTYGLEAEPSEAALEPTSIQDSSVQ